MTSLLRGGVGKCGEVAGGTVRGFFGGNSWFSGGTEKRSVVANRV